MVLFEAAFTDFQFVSCPETPRQSCYFRQKSLAKLFLDKQKAFSLVMGILSLKLLVEQTMVFGERS